MPDIITRALLESKGIPTRDIVAAIWGRKLSGGYEPAEATGTLPLTFRSDGTALMDYRIYGNTVDGEGVGVQTENLFDPNAAETSGNNIISDFMPLDTSEQVLTMAFDIPLRASYNYEITYYDSTKTAISFVGGMGEAYKTRETVKLNRQSEAATAAYVKVTLPKDLTNVLIQNGSTDGAYIPYGYKLPMVSRTRNLFDYTAKDTSKGYRNNCVLINGGTNAPYTYYISEYIDVSNLESVSFFNLNLVHTAGLVHIFLDEEKNRLLNFTVTTQRATRQVPANAHYMQLSILKTVASKITVAEGSTAPDHFIPYHRTDTPVYIGGAQLMKDEYVSYGKQKVYKRTAQLYNSDAPDVERHCYYYKNGVKVNNAAHDESGFIPVIADIYILRIDVDISGFVCFVNFYDSNKNFVSNLAKLTNPSGTHSITVPQDGYVRFNTVPTRARYTFVNDATAPQTYMPYLAPQDPPVPLPELPTFSDADTVLDYEETPAPEEAWVKYLGKKGD